ncbi:MAG TPA: hypothetical protein VKW77_00365, partial [Acidimicrobiales bacterium]|nr:hypothetical protein [Acidimicrobiales bacterium]
AEALVEGLAAGVTLAAALLAVAPISLLLEPFEVVEALPGVLAGTGSAIAAALNLIPGVAASFAAVAEAQRLRGWRPRGPRSWTAAQAQHGSASRRSWRGRQRPRPR